MPIIKSQIKRVKVTAQENAINTAKRTKVKNAMKKFAAAVEAKDVELATKLYPETISVIDVAYNDGVYHRNTVARKKSVVSKQFASIK